MRDDKGAKYTLVGPIEHATSVTVPSLHEGIEPILLAQGCRIIKGNVVVVQYPPGSKRQELYPRAFETRSLVIFPNQFEVLEAENRYGDCTALFVDNPEQQ